MIRNFYTTVEKALKPKVREFLDVIPTIVEITREKLAVEDGGRGLMNSIK